MNRLAFVLAASLVSVVDACSESSSPEVTPAPDGGAADGAAPAPDAGSRDAASEAARLDASGPALAATAADVTRLCTSSCGWKGRCSTAPEGCVAECEGDFPAAAKLRQAYVTGVAACFDALACGTSDDACYASYTLADPAYPNVPVVKACLVRREECGTGTISDDRCASLAASSDEARREAEACLTKPCSDLRTCLDAARGF